MALVGDFLSAWKSQSKRRLSVRLGGESGQFQRDERDESLHEYGFADWRLLTRHVEETSSRDATAEANAYNFQLGS